MRAHEAMNLLVYRCTQGETVESAARLMRDENIGFLPVLAKERLVGVVTDRDLVVRVLAAGRSPTTALGAIASTTPLFVCDPHEDLETVEQRMALAHVHQMVVVDDQNRCLGVVSLSDIAHIEPDPRRVTSLLNAVARQFGARGQPAPHLNSLGQCEP